MGNDSVKRFDVFITYTHMRAADGSDDRGCATWLLTSMRERVNERGAGPHIQSDYTIRKKHTHHTWPVHYSKGRRDTTARAGPPDLTD